MKKLEHWIAHPFLFGVYWVVALLAHNIQQTTPLLAVRSLLFALILTVILLVISRIILRNWQKAALVTSLAVLLFFVYGSIFSLLVNIHPFGIKIARNSLLFGLFAVVVIIVGWLTLKKLNMPAWTRTLNVIGIIAVILPIAQIGYFEARTAFLTNNQSRPTITSAGLGLQIPDGKIPPDIYYIILDTYTRADAMEHDFGFDNSGFLNSLEQKGFYVASCSQSNYPSTELSLTSSLNLDYLISLNKDFSPPNTNIDDLYPFLQNNTVQSVLRDLGYKFIAFDSGYSPTDFRNADYYYSPLTDIMGALTIGGLNPFEVILMQNSAGIWLYDYSLNHPELKVFFDYSFIMYRNRMTYAMDNLRGIGTLPGPKFVFVHLLAPHNPFAFGPNGEFLIRNFPFTLNNDRDAANPPDFAAGYTNEVSYLNKRFLEIVDQLISKSATPPIIIIQGDHGIPRIPGWNMAILNAYYLPDGGNSKLYSSISPVNSFRIVFDTYFGGHLNILNDTTCNSSSDNPFGCTALPDPNPQCQTSVNP
jgi:hypothetical protein